MIARNIIAPAMLALVMAGLAACQSEPPADNAAPEGKPGVEVSHARLVLPAVAGNPAAVYFDVVNNGDDTAVIRAADTAGSASTDMHMMVKAAGRMYMDGMTPLNLVKGEPASFEPGGKHLMVNGLDPVPTVGSNVEVTLTFMGGDKLSFPAKVQAAGDDR